MGTCRGRGPPSSSCDPTRTRTRSPGRSRRRRTADNDTPDSVQPFYWIRARFSLATGRTRQPPYIADNVTGNRQWIFRAVEYLVAEGRITPTDGKILTLNNTVPAVPKGSQEPEGTGSSPYRGEPSREPFSHKSGSLKLTPHPTLPGGRGVDGNRTENTPSHWQISPRCCGGSRSAPMATSTGTAIGASGSYGRHVSNSKESCAGVAVQRSTAASSGTSGTRRTALRRVRNIQLLQTGRLALPGDERDPPAEGTGMGVDSASRLLPTTIRRTVSTGLCPTPTATICGGRGPGTTGGAGREPAILVAGRAP